jgi:ACT domain-containing protein
MENRQKSTQSTLNTDQFEVIRALVGGATVTSATKAAGVDRSTFYLWMKSDPEFVAELNRAQKERETVMRAQLHSLVDAAVEALEIILAPEVDIPPAVRLKAALEILARSGAHA